MLLFTTTDIQKVRLATIVEKMYHAGIDTDLIIEAGTLAETDQGMFNLFAMWEEETDPTQQNEIIKDIENSIKDYSVKKVVYKPFFHGRADTVEKKRFVIEQLYEAWVKIPEQEFAQLMVNFDVDLYWIHDSELAEFARKFAETHSK